MSRARRVSFGHGEEEGEEEAARATRARVRPDQDRGAGFEDGNTVPQEAESASGKRLLIFAATADIIGAGSLPSRLDITDLVRVIGFDHLMADDIRSPVCPNHGSESST